MKRKSDLVNTVSELTGLDEKVASKAVTAVFNAILDSLACEESVMITNFGKFDVKQRGGFEMNDIHSKSKVFVDTRSVPKFTFADSVRVSFRDNQQSKYVINTEANHADNECKNRENL